MYIIHPALLLVFTFQLFVYVDSSPVPNSSENVANQNDQDSEDSASIQSVMESTQLQLMEQRFGR